MSSDLPAGRAEWERAERAVDRLIAARNNLMLAHDQAGQDSGAPLARTVNTAERPSGRWPTVILLAALSISVALIVSAAFISIALLL
ncbi:MAG: hypothetical protein AB7V13_04390 [Pseudorhodoplanes sp.]|uniref:hypothetical protein n=1 Tax=Pseudorhodoplanes sp. TaxID=1934341 RepID=UPI003D13208D